MLSHSDIRTLSELAYLEQERVPIRALAERLDWSADHTARIVSDLESRGYVTADRVRGRKQVALAFVRPVEEFVDLVREFAHVDFADLIAGSALRILYYLETDRTATELAELTGLSRSTVYRRLDRLQNVGIVHKDHSRYALTPDFTGLAGFAHAVATHEHRMEVRAHGVEPRLVWESLDEYLFECPGRPVRRGVPRDGARRVRTLRRGAAHPRQELLHPLGAHRGGDARGTRLSHAAHRRRHAISVLLPPADRQTRPRRGVTRRRSGPLRPRDRAEPTGDRRTVVCVPAL